VIDTLHTSNGPTPGMAEFPESSPTPTFVTAREQYVVSDTGFVTSLPLAADPSEGVWRDTLGHCLDRGCTLSPSGGASATERYRSDSWSRGEEITREQLLADFEQADDASLTVWYNGRQITVEKNVSSEVAPERPHLSLVARSIEYRQATDEVPTTAEIRRRVEQYVELVRIVAEFVEPPYGYGTDDIYGETDDPPDRDRLEAGAVEQIFPLMLFGPEGSDAIGRERLRTAPAWHVTELATDAVLTPIRLGTDWYEQKQELAAHLGSP
jgi:hypothetical protein